MMRKPRFNSTVLRTMAILVALGLSGGCSRGGVAAPASDSLSRDVRQSVARSGGAISAQSKILTPVVVGQPVVIELVFGTDPWQDLWLDIADSDGYQLKGDYRRVLDVHKSGAVKEYLQVTPLKTGKQYLKMTVTHAGGGSPRALVVILPVMDKDGDVPQKTRQERSRIELPATPMQ